MNSHHQPSSSGSRRLERRSPTLHQVSRRPKPSGAAPEGSRPRPPHPRLWRCRRRGVESEDGWVSCWGKVRKEKKTPKSLLSGVPTGHARCDVTTCTLSRIDAPPLCSCLLRPPPPLKPVLTFGSRYIDSWQEVARVRRRRPAQNGCGSRDHHRLSTATGTHRRD